jgi:hypothetical protein
MTHKRPHPTPERKKDRTSDRVAILALGLSILSSAFAAYQWWSSADDAHIRAAIEISNKYDDDAINPTWVAEQVAFGASSDGVTK